MLDIGKQIADVELNDDDYWNMHLIITDEQPFSATELGQIISERVTQAVPNASIKQVVDRVGEIANDLLGSGALSEDMLALLMTRGRIPKHEVVLEALLAVSKIRAAAMDVQQIVEQQQELLPWSTRPINKAQLKGNEPPI